MLIYVNAPSTAVDTAARVEVAVHRAAFLLWRLNWIHPFEDGNGRTARTASYLVFCANVGFRLPGERAVPEILAHEYKFRHLDALEAADAAWQDGERIDVSDLERVLVDALVEQLKPGT
jgi:prophage maintenance system killer protein